MILTITGIDTDGGCLTVSAMVIDDDTGLYRDIIVFTMGDVANSDDDDVTLFRDLFGFNVNLDYDDTGETGNSFDEVSLSVAVEDIADCATDYIGKVVNTNVNVYEKVVFNGKNKARTTS